MKECPIDLNGIPTMEELNILPLGSYDDLIGMDWLEKHRENVDCYANIIECHDDKGRPIEIKGIP